jgi:Cof subfamily protein (haloacid dehalogenase superfamily)
MTDTYNDIRLLAIDIDGTLLTSNRTLSQANHGAIRKASQCGIQVVLASGRPPFAIYPILEQLEMDGTIISYNGALVLEKGHEHVYLNRQMTTRDLHTAVRILREFDLYTSYYLEHEYYVEKVCPEMEWEAWVMGKQPHLVQDLLSQAPPQAHNLMVVSFNDSDRLHACYEEMRSALPHITIHNPGTFYFELNPVGSSKGVSLAHVCGLQQINPDQVAAIGNGVNDLEMLGFARVGVVVSNAPRSLLDIYDFQVRSNDEDGVAEAIERLLAHHSLA